MVDTLASGASGGNPVEVQVLSQAPVTSSGPTTGRRSGPHNPGYRGLSCLRPAPLDPANTARPQDTHRRPSCAAHSNARLKVGAATREQPPRGTDKPTRACLSRRQFSNPRFCRVNRPLARSFWPTVLRLSVRTPKHRAAMARPSSANPVHYWPGDKSGSNPFFQGRQDQDRPGDRCLLKNP